MDCMATSKPASLRRRRDALFSLIRWHVRRETLPRRAQPFIQGEWAAGWPGLRRYPIEPGIPDLRHSPFPARQSVQQVCLVLGPRQNVTFTEIAGCSRRL
jgi:hypothetical protein